MKALQNLQGGKYTLEQELGRGGFGITKLFGGHCEYHWHVHRLS